MSKKIILTISFIVISFLFSVPIVLADCSDCSPGNCAECGCVENDSRTTCVYSNYDDDPTSCGNNMVTNIPTALPKVISIAYTLIQIAVPVVLVVLGTLDLFKGITASKEDEIKKGQTMFIKRLIAAALVFFVFVIVKLIISFVADDGKSDNKAIRIMDCAECFIKKECDS